MKDNKSRRDLIAEYKERDIIGGVFMIENTKNGRVLIKYHQDSRGYQNRFNFSKSVNSAVEMRLQADWNEYGADAFELDVLEELKKTDAQSDQSFKDDLVMLTEMWREKYADREMY